MKIQHCHPNLSDGSLCDIPLGFYTFLSPWAKNEYRKYEFGTFLKQEFYHSHFNLCIFTLVVEEAAELCITYDNNEALQVMLQGSEYCKLFLLPENDHIAMRSLPPESFRIHCPPTTIEWMQLQWNERELNNFSEDIPFYRQRILKSLPPDTNQLHMRLTFIMRIIINRIRYHQKSMYWSQLELKICLWVLLLRYFDNLKENIGIAERYPAANKKTIIRIGLEIKEDPNIYRSVQYYADKYDISVNSLKEDFTKVFSINISAYIESECMKCAEHLLHYTDLQLEEIARQFGYTHTINFTIAFKRYFNYGPRIFRNMKT